MVTNICVTCNVCSVKIRLRMQIGFRNIDFKFYCPECSTELSGTMSLENIPRGFKSKNLTECNDEQKQDTKYVQELSSEFLQRKIEIDSDEQKLMLTPFLRTFALGGEKLIEKVMKMENYNKFYHYYKNDLSVIQNLYLNKKFVHLNKKINQQDFALVNLVKKGFQNGEEIKFTSELDYLMIIHQVRNQLINNILLELNQQMILKMPEKIKKYLLDKIEMIEPLYKYFGENNKYNYFYSRMNEVTAQFLELSPSFLSIISSMDEYRDELKTNQYTISFSPLLQLTNLYQKMYELFCDGIDLIIGLNNIYNRNDLNKFVISSSNSKTFEDVINSYNSKYKKYTDLLMIFDTFSEPFTFAVHNKIRNAEGHFNRNIDINNHEILFKDLYRGRERDIRIDYIDFIVEATKLFNKLNVLNEYYYQLNKFYFVFEKKYSSSYVKHVVKNR